MSLAEPHRGFRLTGWHVLAILGVFFGLTFAVDGVMVIDAYHSFPGEVASSPYEDGLAYDSQLDQQAAQATLGWRMTAGLSAAGRIRLTAVDRSGAPLPGLRLEARLERPATEQGRRTVSFRETSPGVYVADAGRLAGAWDLRLSARDAQGCRFDAERRLIAP
jgi:nitrogen fixation protein FixH